MTTDSSRSSQVIEKFKKHKLAASALRRVRDLIQGFERDRAADLRLARIGIIITLLLLGALALQFFGTESLTLP